MKQNDNLICGENATKKPSLKLEDFKDLISSQEVCELLNISIHTLYKWVEQGKIPHYRLSPKTIMFNKKALIEWLSSKEVY